MASWAGKNDIHSSVSLVERPRLRLRSCPRCQIGDMYLHLLDLEWVCLQCGHRMSPFEGRTSVGRAHSKTGTESSG